MIDALESRSTASAERRWPSWLEARPDALVHHGMGSFMFVVFTVLLLGVSSIVAFGVKSITHGNVPFLPMLAALVALEKPAFDAIARRAFGARGTFIAWSWFLGLSTFFAMSALIALADPIVSSHWRCGTGDIGFVLITPLFVLIFGSLVAASLRPLVGVSRPRGERVASRVLAFTAVMVSLVAGFEIVRSAWLTDAEGYLRSRPVVARLAAVSLPPRPAETADTAIEAGTRTRDLVGDWSLVRSCSARTQGCELSVARAGAEANALSLGWFMGDETFSISRVESQHLVIISRETGSVTPVAAFDDRDGSRRSIAAAQLTSLTAAPRAWSVAALAGIVLCLLVAASMRRIRQRIDADLACFRANDANTVLTFFGAPPRDRAHYRDAAHANRRVELHGSLASLQSAASAALWGRAMFALAMLTIATAPMLAFAWVHWTR